MKRLAALLTTCLLAGSTFAATGDPTDVTKSFVTGTPDILSINAIAFGPQGVLFVGDSKHASVFAIETGDINDAKEAGDVSVEGFDVKLAATLGTTVDQIEIQDIAVNPLSRKVYVAVQRVDGTPALLVLDNGTFQPVKLDNIRYAASSIANAVAEDAVDGRGRPLRVWTISDLTFADGKVMVTGLSNQEFSSTFRSIPFPFSKEDQQASLEIYHASHGRFETTSPVKTFTTATIAGKEYLVASYTCTPLVLFPLDQLKAGEHVIGRTVAELGSMNTPLDMITMEKDGKSYLLMANSSRALMKISYDNLASFEGTLKTPVEEPGETAGVHFIALPFVNVQQLDKFDDSRFVVLQRTANGSLDLLTVGNRLL